MNTQTLEAVDGKAELVLTEKALQRQAADQIGVAFDKAAHSEVTAMRDIVRCGLLILEQEKLLKYGQLGPWLKKHVFPEVAPEKFERCWRKARRWADLAAEICSSFNLLSGEKYAIPIEVLRQNGRICRFLRDARNAGTQEVSLADVLVLPPIALTGGAREVQLRLFDLIDGKTPYQLTQQLRRERQKHEYHPSHKTVEDRLADAKWLITEDTKLLVRCLSLYHEEQFTLLAPSDQRDLRLALDNLKSRLPRV